MAREVPSLERVFPGIDTVEEDILGGIPDFTNGRAVEFFITLSEQDREMVQWYTTHHIGSSYGLSFYLDGLVRGYCNVDPNRTASEAKKGVHSEINRLERFAELILDATDFFPIISQIINIEKDEDTGEVIEITENGWDELGVNGPGGSLENQQMYIRSEFMPVLSTAREFIDSPDSNDLYNQEQILKDYKKEIETERY